MWEYYIMNTITGETTTIWGYSLENAFKREGLNPMNWILIFSDYID